MTVTCLLTETWTKSPYASRPTTDVQAHQMFDLMVLGYYLAITYPAASIDERLKAPLNEVRNLVGPVEDGACELVSAHRDLMKLCGGSTEVSPTDAFRGYLLGFALGQRHSGLTVLSPTVQAALVALHTAELPAQTPEQEEAALSPEQQARIAALRARIAEPIAPLEPVALPDVLPPGILTPAPVVTPHQGAPEL